MKGEMLMNASEITATMQDQDAAPSCLAMQTVSLEPIITHLVDAEMLDLTLEAKASYLGETVCVQTAAWAAKLERRILQQLAQRPSNLRATKYRKENHRPKKRKTAHKTNLTNKQGLRVTLKAVVKAKRAIIVEILEVGLIFAEHAL